MSFYTLLILWRFSYVWRFVQGIDPNDIQINSIVKYSYPTSFKKFDILNIETQTIFIKLDRKKKESDILILGTQMVSKKYLKKNWYQTNIW